MQDIKTRQDYYEVLNTYRQGMLTETIRTNKLEEKALRAIGKLKQVERGREERENILEARGKYGEPGARAIFPEATARQFPEGLPPEKETDISAEPRAGRALKEYDRLGKIKREWESFEEGTKGQKNIMRIIEEQFGGQNAIQDG